MSTTTIMENDHITLYYHHDKQMVHHIYKPGIGGQTFKDGLLNGLEWMKKHKAVKWLSDNHLIEGHSDEESQWVNDVWLPKAIAAGWKYWALVVPSSVKGRMNMNEFMEMFFEKGVRVMVFTEPDEAMEWLETINKEAQPG